MSQVPQSYLPVLELAEKNILKSQVPDDQTEVLERCRKRRLIKLKREKVPVASMRIKARRTKKASQLLPGDFIQLTPDDGNGFRVLSVSLLNSSEVLIHVRDAGTSADRSFTVRSDREYNVFAGEPPGNYRQRLILTSEGRDALDLLREAAELPASANAVVTQSALENGSKVHPDDVPAEFREGGNRSGEILSSSYVLESEKWPYFHHKKQFTDAKAQGTLTKWIQVGRPYAYRYDELSALSRILMNKDED